MGCDTIRTGTLGVATDPHATLHYAHTKHKSQMFNQQQIALVLSKVEEVSKLETADDDIDVENEFFDPCDHFGGNFDDAYHGGRRTGRIEFARELMNMLTSGI